MIGCFMPVANNRLPVYLPLCNGRTGFGKKIISMQRHEANILKDYAWSNGTEACLFCVHDDVIKTVEDMESMTLPDGTSTFNGRWFVCVDGRRSPENYQEAEDWLDRLLCVV